MENDEDENATHFQNIKSVKIRNKNFAVRISSTRELQESNEESIYNEVDNLFFENIAEYTKDPCKLITRLKEKYMNEFMNWKYLHTDNVEHGDLVRMRGMILSGMQTVFSLNAVITEEEDGGTRTVCGILRNRVNCSNIKETKGMTRRNAYILVPERGITDWYLKTFHDKIYQEYSEVLLKNEESRTCALFYDEGSENFKPNAVFDLYGIVDLTEIRVEDEDDDPNTKSSLSTISLHVIHYEPVKHNDIVSSAYPEVLKQKNVQGFESLIYAFEQFFGNKVIAQSLTYQLFISQHSQQPKSVDTFPYTIKKIYDSKPIVEMIKLFIPKVYVIKMMQKTMEESWASYEKPQSGFEQGRENCNLIKNFLSTRKIPFIYPYQTVEIESSTNVLVLSGEKCFFGQEGFAMVIPKSWPKDVKFVRQYAVEHESELNLCRHALLSCSESFCNVSICKTVEEMAVENFLKMQRTCRNTDDNSARLHRQLIISKLLTSLKGEKIVDEDSWTTALELESGRLTFLL
ncbi:unnamed protein product [Cercopithifilaria johnstoni]|uniref:Mini-chromosome maintenance complex-binding protein n=1 Tax=Cercopithifilaria johnstoni TaxID=2874296 RepID=A0A8J2QAC4_9BILA|nr:unnamed protein product [Cercopithifilaria johnstoni]